MHKTCAVEEHIDLAVFGGSGLNGSGVHHIEQLGGAAAFLLQRGQGLRIDIGGNDLCALLHKGQCSGAAYALTRSGDQGGFACEAV